MPQRKSTVLFSVFGATVVQKAQSEKLLKEDTKRKARYNCRFKYKSHHMKMKLLLCFCILMLHTTMSFCQGFPNRHVVETKATRQDQSGALWAIIKETSKTTSSERGLLNVHVSGLSNAVHPAGQTADAIKSPNAAVNIEQTYFGTKPSAKLVESFDGLGAGFEGPQGTATVRNPSDNSLAVGMDHIVQTVNSRMAIFTKKGSLYDTTGRVLYGPVETRNVFRGFGGPCERINNGDAVVRYDQLADRWLIVMPTFRRSPSRNHDSLPAASGPGKATRLYIPAKDERLPVPPRKQRITDSTFCMCYAVSTSPDPFGPYYRYEFERQLFPDYPRPSVWPDGYYTTTSTGDDVIQKHAYVVDRAKMLKGEDATEQSFIINDVNFLVNADLDGKQLPPAGAPNIMMAAGGTQLKKIMEDDGIYAWKFHVDWKNPSKTKLEGPVKIPVAPYHYLCDGQLTRCVPQPGTEIRLDAQGDKIMARLVYRRIGNRESIVAVHSVNTAAGGGGVRWYEFRLGKKRKVYLHQQGTYAPDHHFRWMASPAIDKNGNIGIGYSYGASTDFPGQRFAGRLSADTPGVLSLNETILIEGEASQTNTLRWEDYTQTAIDPADDCTIWYVGDYLKKNERNYSSRIGAFRMPGCPGGSR
jgi:hypothetical protein